MFERLGGLYSKLGAFFYSVYELVTFSSLQPIMLSADLVLEDAQVTAGSQLYAGPGLESAIKETAEEVAGFSGREIAKLMISVQGAAYGSPDGMLSKDLFKRVVRWKVEEHHKKDSMRKKTML
jgi:hypothetical protein